MDVSCLFRASSIFGLRMVKPNQATSAWEPFHGRVCADYLRGILQRGIHGQSHKLGDVRVHPALRLQCVHWHATAFRVS